MKFRKKPVVVEAFLYTGMLSVDDAPIWCHSRLQDGTIYCRWDGALLIKTLEGTMTADVGDWIIQGVAGEIYPCKPDIFEATYEVVE